MTKWEVVNKEDSDFIDIMAEGWYEVCRISKAHPRTATSRETADARLISTVPDMLRVLEQLSNCDLNEGNCASLEVACRRIRNLVEPVLKKARGEGD